jgi:hypothetical protein
MEECEENNIAIVVGALVVKSGISEFPTISSLAT